ncbi:hypothetical protein MP228_004318 [Amoeboaphelidium protococcarum]|nr:hypothetical protein MP228_004318 [Amoeboaphelidium protococcarum]
MPSNTARKCTLNQALDLNPAEKKDFVAWARSTSVSLSFASRMVYLALNVWHEQKAKLPDLSHQQEYATMLEHCCNRILSRSRKRKTAEHTGALTDLFTQDLLDIVHQEDLARANPNLYNFQARKMEAAIRWHLTETMFVYQKRVLGKQLETYGITGKKLIIFQQLMNALVLDSEAHAHEHLDNRYLSIDPTTSVSAPSEEDLGRTDEEQQHHQRLKDEILEMIAGNQDVQLIVEHHRQYLLDIVTCSYNPKAKRRRYSRREKNPRQLSGAVGIPAQVRHPSESKKKQSNRHQMNMANRAGPAFGNVEGQKDLLQYMSYLQQLSKDLKVKQFDMFPTSSDVPSYFQIDMNVLQHSGLKRMKQAKSVRSIINFKKVGLRKYNDQIKGDNQAGNEDVTFTTDGYGCSVVVEVENRAWTYANKKEDLLTKHHRKDVSKLMYGAVALADCDNLNERLQNCESFGVDPGQENPLVCSTDTVVDNQTSMSGAKRQFRQSPHLTGVHWRKLTLEKQYEAAEAKLKPAAIKEFERLASEIESKVEYVALYKRYFAEIFEYYSRAFHRVWRLRKFMARQSAYDRVLNHILNGRDKPSVPKVNDAARTKQSANFQRLQRARYGKMLDPTVPVGKRPKPPVIGYGNAGVKHMKKHPPVPVRGFAYKMSRRALVVMIPEYCTTKLHANCHHELHMHDMSVNRCNHTKKLRMPPDRDRVDDRGVVKLRRPVFCCINEEGQQLHAASNCPDRERKLVKSRLGICQNCRVQDAAVFVDRDVNASCGMKQVLVFYAENHRRPDWNQRRVVGRTQTIQGV